MRFAATGTYNQGRILVPSCEVNHPILQKYARWDWEERRCGQRRESVASCDGSYRWVKGRVDGEVVFGEQDVWGYAYEIEYIPGPKDAAWAAEQDRKYLMAILWGERSRKTPDVKKLELLEPGVYFWWRNEGSPPDIGAWWMSKLALPNIREIVIRAEVEYKAAKEQARQARKARKEAQGREARLTALRNKLQSLVAAVKAQLQAIHAKLSLVVPEDAVRVQQINSGLIQLQPLLLDEPSLTRAISELENQQYFLQALAKRVTALQAKQIVHQRILELQNKLQELLSAATKIINPLLEQQTYLLLPLEEQSALRNFMHYLRSLNPKSANEASLTKEIAGLTSKHQYILTVQQKIDALSKQRAVKIAGLERKLQQLKLSEVELTGNYARILKSYFTARKHYRALDALGIDCRQQLALIEQKLTELQSRPPVPPKPVPVVQQDYPIVPYAELQFKQEIGLGAFGAVYRGIWGSRQVAIKKLHAIQLSDHARQAFLTEVAIMSKLKSERLVQLYGACLAPDPYCIVMEYLPRGSLYRMLHSVEQYDWAVSLQIAIDIGNGLALLHQEGIIHRDLKSLNVLLDAHYRAKLGDFGLSKVRQEVSVTSTRPIVVGTNAWNAPELFGLRPKYSFASDIYAYGIILWEIFTRAIPYQDVVDPNEVKSAVQAGEREEIPATCPATYRETIERCWAQAPEQRPQALQVAQVLMTLGMFAGTQAEPEVTEGVAPSP